MASKRFLEARMCDLIMLLCFDLKFSRVNTYIIFVSGLPSCRSCYLGGRGGGQKCVQTYLSKLLQQSRHIIIRYISFFLNRKGRSLLKRIQTARLVYILQMCVLRNCAKLLRFRNSSHRDFSIIKGIS